MPAVINLPGLVASLLGVLTNAHDLQKFMRDFGISMDEAMFVEILSNGKFVGREQFVLEPVWERSLLARKRCQDEVDQIKTILIPIMIVELRKRNSKLWGYLMTSKTALESRKRASVLVDNVNYMLDHE